ncbi:hypothetical protein BST81_10085 [Leptolyngbya sp. 'hensonii']|uniref:glycosyltransferase family 2 protein n=1 Tax=Leptolyngbya sp. 'hensonii' TaxID=1922337 RepID=UPI00094FE59C|nr:glycosyltransferase family A protein [Leptolyngbya sp. 'hensonii']OLP18624.1 hypothetical protein BST81_10085 [Leptolyngbya sp. 'hensonii']
MSQPLVSIGIPVYNREKLVRQAIESALAQTYSNLEIIVVDNCSTDNTHGVIQEYSRMDHRVRCYRNEQNLGPVPNWYRCLELSQGEYFKILFSDDWLEPTAIATLTEPFHHHPQIAFTYSTAIHHYACPLDGQMERLLFRHSPGGLLSSFDFLWESALYDLAVIPVTPSAALFRRQDALSAFTLHIPCRLEFDCNRRGMGNDAMLFWKPCARYPEHYHILDPLVHFAEGAEGEASFTMSMIRSGQLATERVCYQSAFGHFLATTPLPGSTRQILQAGMFWQRVPADLAHLEAFLAEFALCFPPEYPWWEFDLQGDRIRELLDRHSPDMLRAILAQLPFHPTTTLRRIPLELAALKARVRGRLSRVKGRFRHQ